jgi:hypothetical protein
MTQPESQLINILHRVEDQIIRGRMRIERQRSKLPRLNQGEDLVAWASIDMLAASERSAGRLEALHAWLQKHIAGVG